MLSFALLWAVCGQSDFANDLSPATNCDGCGLGAYDPKSVCCVDASGYPSLDGDDTDGKFKLEIFKTTAISGENYHYKDVFGTEHPPTKGKLEDDTTDNKRYVLACPQDGDAYKGKKTIKMVITRDATLTRFGAEWVKLFEKDSWKNETNEYEPYTFNEYGAKIPIAYQGDDSRSPSHGLSSTATDTNKLTIFMEIATKGDFEIMYGNPALTYAHTNGETYWVPVRFQSTNLRVGNPWAKCDSADSLPTLDMTDKVGSIMPVFFGGPNTASIAMKKKKGTTEDVPENYLTVVSELSNSPVKVMVVLDIFAKDGEETDFNEGEEDKYTDAENNGGKYTMCYKAGNACPEGHSVCDASYCEMQVWKRIIKDFQDAGTDIKVLGLVDDAAAFAKYEVEQKRTVNGLGLNGYFYKVLGTSTSTTAKIATFQALHKTATGTMTSVMLLGQPLFDYDSREKAHVYVTIADDELGVWNPYSWYADTEPDRWAAVVTGASSDATTDEYFKTTVNTLVDRGYGWIYTTDQTGEDAYAKKNTLVMKDILAAIEAPTMERRLTERRLTASAPYWGCDDTLFMCKPICLQRTGVVTSKVADRLCASAPMDQCACKCYHEAQWTCDGDAVVCKARMGSEELQTVGDKVCEMRGAPKPASTAELRIASTCEPVTEMRGDAPTSTCLAQWATTTTQPTEAPEATEAPADAATSASVEEKKVSVPVIQESFAAAMAFLALAVYA